MAGRPLGSDDSQATRDPGDTSLLQTMMAPGLSGQPMRPAAGPNHNAGMMPMPPEIMRMLQANPKLLHGLMTGQFSIEQLIPLLRQMQALRSAGSPF